MHHRVKQHSELAEILPAVTRIGRRTSPPGLRPPARRPSRAVPRISFAPRIRPLSTALVAAGETHQHLLLPIAFAERSTAGRWPSVPGSSSRYSRRKSDSRCAEFPPPRSVPARKMRRRCAPASTVRVMPNSAGKAGRAQRDQHSARVRRICGIRPRPSRPMPPVISSDSPYIPSVLNSVGLGVSERACLRGSISKTRDFAERP